MWVTRAISSIFRDNFFIFPENEAIVSFSEHALAFSNHIHVGNRACERTYTLQCHLLVGIHCLLCLQFHCGAFDKFSDVRKPVIYSQWKFRATIGQTWIWKRKYLLSWASTYWKAGKLESTTKTWLYIGTHNNNYVFIY